MTSGLKSIDGLRKQAKTETADIVSALRGAVEVMSARAIADCGGSIGIMALVLLMKTAADELERLSEDFDRLAGEITERVKALEEKADERKDGA